MPLTKSQFRLLLLRISKSLSKEDVESLVFLSMDLINDKTIADECVAAGKALQFFEVMMARNLYVPDDPLLLFEHLTAIDRQALVNEINQTITLNSGGAPGAQPVDLEPRPPELPEPQNVGRTTAILQPASQPNIVHQHHEDEHAAATPPLGTTTQELTGRLQMKVHEGPHQYATAVEPIAALGASDTQTDSVSVKPGQGAVMHLTRNIVDLHLHTQQASVEAPSSHNIQATQRPGTSSAQSTVTFPVDERELYELASNIGTSHLHIFGQELGLTAAQVSTYEYENRLHLTIAFFKMMVNWKKNQHFHSNVRENLALVIEKSKCAELADKFRRGEYRKP